MVALFLKSASFKISKSIKISYNFIQTANITGRGTRGGPLKLKKPFPYEEKPFKWYHSLFDETLLRLSEENAKIIVVEGPIAAGKSAFGKHLAEQLDMKFIPDSTIDDFYTLPSGYNLRQHDHLFPELLRSYDHKDFCRNPKDPRAIVYQTRMFDMRFYSYVDAMVHLMNTGQGVVLERSSFSDFVFAKSMFENGYISKEAYDVYSDGYKNSSTFLLPPHLIIYLHCPIPVVEERIRTRNYSYEQCSPALTREYLTSLETNWKELYLKNAEKYSEILIYDWSEGGDVELIVDDIEKFDFDVFREDKKFMHWGLTRRMWYTIRKWYTNDPYSLTKYFSFELEELPELQIDRYLMKERQDFYASIPELQYDLGYNPKVGDKFLKILFKTNLEKHRLDRKYIMMGGCI